MLAPLLIAATLIVGQGATLDDVARAQTLLGTGDVLEGTLALRAVADDEQAEGSVRDVARYYLGVLRLDADDVEGAREWFGKIAREPTDVALRLSLAFRLGEVMARSGHPEKVVPTVAPRLRALEKAGLVRVGADKAEPGEVTEAQLSFLALQLAYASGHPEWIQPLVGHSADHAFGEVVARGTPEQVAALARLPGVPDDVLQRIRAFRGADLAVGAALSAPEPLPGEAALTGDLASLAAPAAGAVVVPAPFTGPQAAYGEALKRVLAFAAVQRGVAEPWRFVDTGAEGWTDALAEQLGGNDVALILGPLGSRSLGELAPLVQARPVPVVPLFPDVRDRALAFPVLPLAFDVQDEVRALFAAAPLAAGDRVVVVDGEGAASRGLADLITAEVKLARGEVVRAFTLPADAKAQVPAVASWVAELGGGGPEPAFDVLFLATGPAEGLRVLSLFHFQGVALESSPAYAAAPHAKTPARPVRLYGLHTVLGRGFVDPVTHLSRGVRVADPCVGLPDRVAALETLLGRPAFAVERWAAHLADVVLQARQEAGSGTVRDLARLLLATRRWTGLCGLLDVQEGKGGWEFTAVEVDGLPPTDLPPPVVPVVPSGEPPAPPADAPGAPAP
jgi:hypothetical protein